jgi:hypothetical protein
MPNIAINGLGRIGRAALKQLVDHDTLDLVAVNDIGDLDNLVYLLGHDSVYGRWRRDIAVKDHRVVIDGRDIAFRSERDPAALDWSDLGVDIVLECTGAFRTAGDMRKHLEAGASRVVLSAPAKSDDVVTVVPGVNDGEVLQSDTPLVSTASCTTNCIAPVVEIIGRRIGVEKATMTTVHAYTSTQALVDAPVRARSAGAGGPPRSTSCPPRPAPPEATAAGPARGGKDQLRRRGRAWHPWPQGSIVRHRRRARPGPPPPRADQRRSSARRAGSDRYGRRSSASAARRHGLERTSSATTHGSVVDLTMTQSRRRADAREGDEPGTTTSGGTPPR